MSTALRKPNVASMPQPLSGPIKACGACDQEMASVEGIIPLHMYRGRLCQGGHSEGQDPKFGHQVKAPLTIPEVDSLSISEIVSADTCLACGGPKAPGYVFCRTDYEFLPALHKKCIPPFMRGYLFADENREVRGHYSKKQFMEVFKQALETLSDLRANCQ
jgi:hypothetical protein